jgi:hypothetical protein
MHFVFHSTTRESGVLFEKRSVVCAKRSRVVRRSIRAYKNAPERPSRSRSCLLETHHSAAKAARAFHAWGGASDVPGVARFFGEAPRQAQAEARLSSVRFRAFPSGNLNPVQMRTLCQPQDAWFESHNSVANYYSAHLAENKPAKQPGSRLEIGVHFVLGAGRHRQHARARGMRRWRTAARSPHP